MKRWLEGWIMTAVEWGLRRWVGGLCWSFGGIVQPNPMYQDRIGVRVCLKPRWHTDSHAYDIVDPSKPLSEQTPRQWHAWEHR